MGSSSKNSDTFIFLGILFFGIILYFVPLHNSFFTFDDKASIEDNAVIKQMDLPGIFSVFNTRSLVGLSFALNYQFFGPHPLGYRLINFLIHCVNAFLIFLLIRTTLNLFFVQRPKPNFRLEWPAGFCAMLFLCHPIQTEPVNFITQRFVLMGTLFYLSTLYLYIQYRCQAKKEYFIASLGTAIAAMFCKEFVVTLPIMLELYDFYFLRDVKESIGKRCKILLPFFIIILIVPMLLSRTSPEASIVANIADSNTVQDVHGKKQVIDISRAHGGVGRKEYFLTQLNVMTTYIRLLFVPVNQNLDYDYPISTKLDLKTILCGLFLLGLLIAAILMYRSYRLISFGILWFFLALSIESSFIPIGHVIAEYRLYLASVGFVFVLMSLIYFRGGDLKKLNITAGIILIVFSILTLQRNNVWRDELSLWNDVVFQSPHKARPYLNRGLTYFKRNDFTNALSDYNKAIEIDPRYVTAYNDRGALYYKQGKITLALADYNKALEIDPKNEEAYNNRSVLYSNQGDFNQAFADLNKMIGSNPKDADAYYNRGLIYSKQGQYEQALSNYNKAIELNPNYAEAYNNRSLIYGTHGDLSLALSDTNKAIEINPHLTEAYCNRAVTYFQLKDYDHAWDNVHQAERLGYLVDAGFMNALKKLSGREK